MMQTIWFKLVCAHDDDYLSDRIKASDSTMNVATFREQVQSKFRCTLAYLDAAQLKVFRNQAAFDTENRSSLLASASMNGLGSQEVDAVVVLAPPMRPSVEVSVARRDFTYEWRSELQRSCIAFEDLPFGADLKEFLTNPLPVKI
ncbi:hypothetical protein Poli38472_012344 [Pythium oligandrum]|uniref:Uncharacterized protein n=1 Tax=Pythium oligandrum TaxID=41045 RepID=A0A8K1FR45_PYTOL|nr:hypothetical protein Poli38472_012344 [Pythium oligandrum]|eukprot:TMW67228.1 hypothetical protein Poli38472_012344 [Pythium oligandrum]